MSKTARKIVNTAEQLFYAHGINNIGVDKINEAVGCSKTTMYTHFGSKNKLILAALKLRDEHFRASLLDYIGDAAGKTAVEKIFEWHQAWFEQNEYNGCMFVRALTELDIPDADIKNVIEAHKNWVQALLYEKTQDNKLAQLLMILLEGLISLNLVYGQDQNKRAQYRETVLLLLQEQLG